MPVEKLTVYDYALLGLIGMAPMSGYTVHKIFATTPLAHFSASPGAIYPALNRLARRGLIHGQLDTTTEARPRRIFSLTETGEAAISRWLRQPVTREELIHGSGAPILRFALAEGRISPAEVGTYLDSYRAALEAYVEELEQHHRQIPSSGQLHARLALEHGINGFRSELAWVDSTKQQITRAASRSKSHPKRS